MFINEIVQGNALDILKTMPSDYFNCCITSPPYFGLRDYGNSQQIGLEKTPEEYIKTLVDVFREVRRVLKKDGTLWLNIGDSYASASNKAVSNGYKNKDLIGIPWMLAFALRSDGWYLRSDIIWHKPNAMPESISDRPTKAHEYIFLLSKSERYYYDKNSIKESAVSDHKSGNGFKRNARLSYKNPDGSVRGNEKQWTDVGGKRNRRSVWTVSTKPFKEAHFATFPTDLIEPCVLGGSPEGGVILDPFMGAGTTGIVALKNNRHYCGIEINSDYIQISQNRIKTHLNS